MSMFSTHYLIRLQRPVLYWNGGDPMTRDGWSSPGSEVRPIRIFAREDAERICSRLMVGLQVEIEEDE